MDVKLGVTADYMYLCIISYFVISCGNRGCRLLAL